LSALQLNLSPQNSVVHRIAKRHVCNRALGARVSALSVKLDGLAGWTALHHVRGHEVYQLHANTMDPALHPTFWLQSNTDLDMPENIFWYMPESVHLGECSTTTGLRDLPDFRLPLSG
jgi:hypothetical protein